MIDEVLSLIQEAAARSIMPRFRALREGDIEEKSPGEVVTQADREAEAFITAGLRQIRPGSVVVGEEAAAADSRLLEAVGTAAAVWLVDPLDGTSNFVAGDDRFAVMVALLENGVTTQAWIWLPISREAWLAERGAGTTRNGERIRVSPATREPGNLRGSLRTRFLDDEHRIFAEHAAPSLGEVLPGSGCAGFDYPQIVMGTQDFLLFRRTLPWDHAPGAFLVQEAGGIARRWDGSEYQPGSEGEGLIAAVDDETWQVAAKALLQPRHLR